MSTTVESHCSALFSDPGFFFTACSAISAIPTGFWAAAFASGLTLTGVLISNKNNREQLEIRTRSEAEENRKQRKHELKREIYFEVNEALASVNNLFSNLANIPLTKLDGSKELQRLGAATAKLQIIADEHTANLAGKLSAEIGSLWVKGIKQARQSQRLLDLGNDHQRNADTAKNEWMRFIAVMTEAQAQRGGRPVKEEWVQTNAEYWKNNFQKEQQQIETIAKKQAGARVEYIKWYLEESHTAFEQIAELLGRMRVELEAGGNNERFTDIIRDNRARMVAEIHQLIEAETQG